MLHCLGLGITSLAFAIAPGVRAVAALRELQAAAPEPQEASYAWRPGEGFPEEGGSEGLVEAEGELPLLGSKSRRAAVSMQKEHRSDSQRVEVDVDSIWWSNRIVVPSAKLAFCYIPKNACDRMTRLFNKINDVQPGFQSSTAERLQVNWTKVTRENGWKFAFFTRDPLARYASAWGSKCLPNTYGDIERGGEDCGGAVLWDKVPMRQLASTFQKRVKIDAGRGLFNNEHWLPQTAILERCGWDKFGPGRADFVGHLAGDVTSQVQEMLEMVNVTHSGKLARMFFPVSKVSGHQSLAHDNLATFYSNRSTAEAVLKLYEKDYRLLNLPLIDYVQQREH